ncbi:MAG: LVIVD repeat-containing protein [Candidatus Heimdallarchaeota archaeon]
MNRGERKLKILVIFLIFLGNLFYPISINANSTTNTIDKNLLEKQIINNKPEKQLPTINNLGSTSNLFTQMLINNSFAYCLYWDVFLYIFNFSNPNERILLGYCNPELSLYEEGYMDFFDKYICYIDYFNVSFYDISNPENPHINNTYPIDLDLRYKTDFEIKNKIGFIAGYNRTKINDYNFTFDGSLKILNLTDTTNTIIGEYYNEKLVQDIMIKDNLSVIVDYNVWDEYFGNKDYINGFEIIDISNLTNPIRLSEWQSKCKPSRAKIINNYLFLTTFDRGLLVFDINDPTNPILVNEYKTHRSFRGIFYDENFLYVTFEKGLFILDITDPLNIKKIGKKRIYFEGNGGFGEVIVENNLAYVSRSSEFSGREIFVFDISEPNNPERLYPLGVKIGYEALLYIEYFSFFVGIPIVIITVIVLTIVNVRKRRKKRSEESKEKIKEAMGESTSQEEPIAESVTIK